MSRMPIPYAYIDSEANAGRMRKRLMAIVAAGDRSRIYLSPTDVITRTAVSAEPTWKPSLPTRGNLGE